MRLIPIPSLGLPCRPFTFKPSVLNTPLVRNELGNTLPYSPLPTHIVELGEALGFREILTLLHSSIRISI